MAYADHALIIFWGDEIEEIYTFDPEDNQKIEHFEAINIFPANIFVSSQDTINSAIRQIEIDIGEHVEYFKREGKLIEAQRIDERANYDLEMIRELGYCSGIENYSRYFDKREPGSRPYCLLDYFPSDFIMMIDESHATIPQIKAMYGGDRSRKTNLVDYGFRLPAWTIAPWNSRSLKWLPVKQSIECHPADYELEKSEGVVIEQVIRPTGLLDPQIEVRPSENQIDDLIEEFISEKTVANEF